MEKIPLLVPLMPTLAKTVKYFEQIDANRHYTNFGPLSRVFEEKVLSELGKTYVEHSITSVSNCTVGLELALQAHDLSRGARVLIPAITFVATATAVTRVGMQPVIADVDPLNWSLTPEIVEAALKGGPIDAVMPVATFGRPHSPDDWDQFSHHHGIPVVIDAAGAFGNQLPGSITDVVYSFHATKSFGAAEGGAVVSGSRDRIAKIRMLANFGIDTATSMLSELGTNGKMSEYHCALGLASFDEWAEVKLDRQRLHRKYQWKLQKACPSLVFQDKPEDGIYPLMVALLPRGFSADSVGNRLASVGIQTRRWYCPPLDLHPALSGVPVSGQLTVSLDLDDRIIGLPFFLGITDPQIDRVCQSLAEILGE